MPVDIYQKKDMKTFTVILLIVFVAAVITVPGHVQFNRFLAKKGKNTGTCLGGTRHHSYSIFSLDYVDYCGPAVNDSTIVDPGLKKTHTDKWLGLFGGFWKL
jgi:hypothetical protein